MKVHCFWSSILFQQKGTVTKLMVTYHVLKTILHQSMVEKKSCLTCVCGYSLFECAIVYTSVWDPPGFYRSSNQQMEQNYEKDSHSCFFISYNALISLPSPLGCDVVWFAILARRGRQFQRFSTWFLHCTSNHPIGQRPSVGVTPTAKDVDH